MTSYGHADDGPQTGAYLGLHRLGPPVTHSRVTAGAHEFGGVGGHRSGIELCMLDSAYVRTPRYSRVFYWLTFSSSAASSSLLRAMASSTVVPTAAAAARRPRPLNRPLRRPLRRSLRRHRRHTMRRTSTSDDRGFGACASAYGFACASTLNDSMPRRQAVPLARGRCASELFVLKAVLDVGIMFMFMLVHVTWHVTWHYAVHRSTCTLQPSA